MARDRQSQLTNPDRGPDVLADLAVQGDVVVADKREAAPTVSSPIVSWPIQFNESWPS
jgi:hypothetical protein